jgi:hypothetical protein
MYVLLPDPHLRTPGLYHFVLEVVGYYDILSFGCSGLVATYQDLPLLEADHVHEESVHVQLHPPTVIER